MYKIRLVIENPIVHETRMMTYQIDAATLTQAKWDAAFPAVRAKIDELVEAEANPTRPDLVPKPW